MNLVYQNSPSVTLATNVFKDVPTILQFDDTPLISVVRVEGLGFTTEIPIYHADGTYLAKVNGTRIFPTEDGKKAGIVIRSLPDATVCEMAGKTVFEVAHQKGDAFRLQAELSTPSGFFVKTVDSPALALFDSSGEELRIGGFSISGSTVQGFRIGVWMKSDGSVAFGCN